MIAINNLNFIYKIYLRNMKILVDYTLNYYGCRELNIKLVRSNGYNYFTKQQ